MRISKVTIENFKCYKGKFSLSLNKGINILVGNNEAGKTTILEAIHLALTGILNGRYLKNDVSQYLFNKACEREYTASLESRNPTPPPSIRIEIFLDGPECSSLANLEGNGNSDHSDSCGVSFSVEFDAQYQSEYEELLRQHKVKSIPVEYYRVLWQSFAREAVTSRSIPLKSALIEANGTRMQNGSDVYISRIIRENLEERERVAISQAYRTMKEGFMECPQVRAVNAKINTGTNITEKAITVSVDLSTQSAWEVALMTYLDEIPFHYVGKGEQSVVKTALALCHKKSQEANVILLEEPENHLSHTKLNGFVGRITTGLGDKQLVVTTHSSFVANKLGLDSLILLNRGNSTRLNNLSGATQTFFKKLSGYDTLRVVLCQKAILVEGDSDELVVQKAYRDRNDGRLPIEDGIDVISVGTSFLRFLEVAEKIGKQVTVVTDNDGDVRAVQNDWSERKECRIDAGWRGGLGGF